VGSVPEPPGGQRVALLVGTGDDPHHERREVDPRVPAQPPRPGGVPGLQGQRQGAGQGTDRQRDRQRDPFGVDADTPHDEVVGRLFPRAYEDPLEQMEYADTAIDLLAAGNTTVAEPAHPPDMPAGVAGDMPR